MKDPSLYAYILHLCDYVVIKISQTCITHKVDRRLASFKITIAFKMLMVGAYITLKLRSTRKARSSTFTLYYIRVWVGA